jgi:hypothetical protein
LETNDDSFETNGDWFETNGDWFETTRAINETPAASRRITETAILASREMSARRMRGNNQNPGGII